VLYFAYGSNLHQQQMRRRCKDSIFIKSFILKDHILNFRSQYKVADIEELKGSFVPGAIYDISKSDEKKLDIYEDYPFLYKKKYFIIKDKTVMTYFMNSKSSFKYPSTRYLNIIKQGYKDCKLDMNYLFKILMKRL
tara:strand:- start:117 stop:524 length:408 start_codon:yes stop_codon:yes gene_type:complete